MPRPFRFGMVFTHDADTAGFAELARRTEDDGFSTLLVADHLDNPMACGPLLMAAAAATSTLRIGSYVYNNDLRHPAVLAKEAATIDVLSGGRLELGIGAGWNREEYDQAGLAFDPPRTRVDRMEESLGIIEALFAGGPVHHEGPHYRLNGLEGLPRPVQDHIPILIGGGGPRMMGIAARRADIVGFVPQSKREGGLDQETVPAEVMDERIATLDRAIADAGGRTAVPSARCSSSISGDRRMRSCPTRWCRPRSSRRRPTRWSAIRPRWSTCSKSVATAGASRTSCASRAT